MLKLRSKVLSMVIAAAMVVCSFALSARANVTDVLGTWELQTVADSGQVYDASLKLSLEGDKLAGKIISQLGEMPVADLAYKAGVLTFAIKVEADGQRLVIRYTGKPEGDKIKGTGEYEVGANAGTFTFSGKHTEGAPSGTNADVLGTWTVESRVPDTGEVFTSTLIIKEASDKLSATIITDQGELAPQTVTYAKNELTLAFTFDAQGQEGKATVVGKPAGDLMEGATTFDAPGFMGKLPFKAKRIAKPQSAAVNKQVVGEWNIKVTTPQGDTNESTLKLKEDGGKLGGTYTVSFGDVGELPLTNVKFDGKTLSFTLEINAQGNTFPLNYKGTITEGKTFNGDISGDFNGQTFSFPFQGQKK